MAVSSDDWPRYSFLTGDACSQATPDSDLSSDQLRDVLVAAFTLECWLQLRAPKQRNEGARSWILHSPACAFGAEASGEIVIRRQDTWYTTRPLNSADGGMASTPTMTNRRWTHVAGEIIYTATRAGALLIAWTVVCDSEEIPVRLLINGSVVTIHEYEEPSTDIQGSREPQFCIGLLPRGSTGVPMLLHEMRLWNQALEDDTIAR